MKPYDNKLKELWLWSEVIIGDDVPDFEYHTRGSRIIAGLAQQADIHAENWKEHASDLHVFCRLAGYPHSSPRFYKALAAQLLNAGALSVDITIWRQTLNDWHQFDSARFKPEVVHNAN